MQLTQYIQNLKVVVTLVALTFSIHLLKADVLFYETFPTTSLPTGWTNNIIQGSQGWTFKSSPAMSSSSGGNYAVFDDNALGAATIPNEAALTSLSSNCSNHTNVKLKYTHYWEGVEYTHAYVEISNNGGGTWTTLVDYHTYTRGSLASPQDTIIDVTAYAANQADVQVRFRYTDGSQAGKYWYLDDVVLYSDPDVGITKLVAPNYLVCGQSYTNAETVTVRIYNYSYESVSNVPVTCSITGGITTTLTGTYSGTIPGQSYADYSFVTTVDMSADAPYNFTIYTTLGSDAYVFNDTLLTGRHQLVQSYPYTESFNSGTGGWLSTGDAFTAPDTDRGREFVLGSLPYLNGPQGEGDSWYIEVDRHAEYYKIWVESPVFDFTNNTNPTLSMDIKYQLTSYYSQAHVEYTTDGGTNWYQLGVNTDPNWYEGNTNWWYNNYTTPVDSWTHVEHELCQLSGESCVKFRVLAYAYYGISGSNDYRDRNYFAFDNFEISAGESDDVEPIAITLPNSGICGSLSSTETIQVLVNNNTCRPLYNVPISIQVDGGSVINEVIPGPIPRFGSYLYTFTATADLSGAGVHTLVATTGLTTDGVNSNDVLTETRINNTPINTYPYSEDFNSGNGGWVSYTPSASRHFRLDTLPYLNGSEGEGDSWYVEVTEHTGYEVFEVESPVFDLSSVTNPMLYMDVKYQLTSYYSQFHVEYSLNGGTSWTQLGTNADPYWYEGNTNWWYNNYSSPVDVWTKVQHDLCTLIGESCVKFRVRGYAYYGHSGYNTNLTEKADYRDRNYFAFDNFELVDAQDVGVVAITEPDASVSGCLYSATQQVTVEVYNYGCGIVTNIPVQCDITGTVTTTLTGTVPSIPANSSVLYTFPGTFDMTGLGTYDFDSFTLLASDYNNVNDTTSVSINVGDPKITVYPYFEDFNSGAAFWKAGGDPYTSPDTSRGREFVLGSLPYLNGPQGEGDSWYIDVDRHAEYYKIWVESPVFDFTNNTNPTLSMDIKYQLTSYYSQAHVEYTTDGGTNWYQLGVNTDPNWYEGNTNWWYNNYTTPVDSWTHVEHELCQLSGESCVKFRVLAYAYYGISGSNDYRDRNYFAFDNFEISAGESDDVEPIAITLPNSGICGSLSSTETIQVLVNNNTCRPLYNVPISIQVDGGSVINEVIPGPIPRFGSYLYTFTATADLSGAGVHTLVATTGLTTDGVNSNDVLTETRINNTPINTYPYSEDFNSGNGGWVSYTPSASRHFRLDTLPYLNGSEGEGDSWYVEVTEHTGYEVFEVESPVFDLSSVTNPMLYMDVKYQLTSYYSQFHVEYSLNGGTSWTQLGTNADPYWYEGNTNWWYNNYSSPVDVWTKVQHDLCTLIGESCVKFRVRGYAYYGHSGYNTNLTEKADYRDRNYFAFDNFELVDAQDVGVVAITEPDASVSGCLYSATQQVTVEVYNWSCNTATNVPVQCNITGVLTTTLSGTVPSIPANSSVLYTFPGTFDMTGLGTYDFDSFTLLASDYNNENDSASLSIDVDFPTVSTFPYLENFNSGSGGWLALGDAFTAPDTSRGREFVLGALPYLNGPQGEGDSWYIEVDSHAEYYKIWVESPKFDFTSLTAPSLLMDVKYQFTSYYSQAHIEYSTNGGNTWTQLGTSADASWYEGNTNWWYNNYSSPVDEWTKVEHEICDLAGESCVKFRVLAYAYYGISGSNDYRDRNYFAFDNFEIVDNLNDAAVTQFIEPLQSQEPCTFPANQDVTIRVYNPFCYDLSNIPVYCNITGAITQNLTGTVSVTAGNYVDYTFSTSINMTTLGTYNFVAYSALSGDYNDQNDTITQTIVVYYPLITSIPYYEDFESGANGWVASGSNPPGNNGRQFTLGTLPYLNGPEGNGDSWYADVSTHGKYDKIWVESPVFDFTGLTNPMLSFEIKYQLYNYYTQFQVEYSTNGGVSWSQLGNSSGVDWYVGNTNWWYNNYSNPVDEWQYVEHNLCSLIGETCVKFRIVGYAYYGISGSNDYTDRNRFAFDNISITDTPIDLQLSYIYGCYGSEYSLDIEVVNRDNLCISPAIINSLDLTYSIDGGVPVTQNFTSLSIAVGGVGAITIPNVTVPSLGSEVIVWCSNPNGVTDQIYLNDTLIADLSSWPNCNDHCSNAIDLSLGTTTATQTSNGTADSSEDPPYTACGSITIENTVWYEFTTNASGDSVTVIFENQVCAPSQNGLQISIDSVSTPCDFTTYSNMFCSATNDTGMVQYGPVLLPPNTTYYIAIDGFAGSDCNFNITIEGAVNPPLPIDLLSFDARCSYEEGDVDITWVVSSEQNNDYYTIERSEDGITFEVIGKIDGAGTSSVVHSYNYRDVNVPSGQLYYRLRQTDFNGNFEYFKVKTVNCGKTPEVSVYPNPTSGNVTIEIANNKSLLDYMITTVEGKVVEKGNTMENIVKLNLENEKKGIYLLRIADDNGSKVYKIVKQ